VELLTSQSNLIVSYDALIHAWRVVVVTICIMVG